MMNCPTSESKDESDSKVIVVKGSLLFSDSEDDEDKSGSM